MVLEVTVRGFKNPNNSSLGSRNPLAKQIRGTPWRTRVIRCKKGKGSYFRKGRSKRSFFYFYFTHDVNLVIERVIISYDKNEREFFKGRKLRYSDIRCIINSTGNNFPKLTKVKSPVLSLSVKQSHRQKGIVR